MIHVVTGDCQGAIIKEKWIHFRLTTCMFKCTLTWVNDQLDLTIKLTIFIDTHPTAGHYSHLLWINFTAGILRKLYKGIWLHSN